MFDFEDMFANLVAMGGTYGSMRWRTRKAAIVLHWIWKADSKHTRFSTWATLPPSVLVDVADEFQIVIENSAPKKSRISARFTAEECVQLFAGEWPSEKSFDRIATAVRERKRYPMPKPGIPGEGGKSSSAQGQTKKDGSHSQDRHR